MPRRTIMLLVSALFVGMFSASGANAAVVENGVVGSFDGTLIAYSFAHPDGETPAPVVMMTHGWGGTRTKDFTTGFAKTLLDEGYAVLTWDSRGFGTSGGEANIDSQQYEVRDAQALIDTVLEGRAEVIHDSAEDPRIGMVGGSYAGAIQLQLASKDPRIDAIVPEIAWNDLPQSLKPGGVLKLGWDLALYGAGAATATALGLPAQQTGAYAPQIHQSLAEGVALNDWSTSTYSWFSERSPKRYIDGNTTGGRNIPGVSAPTLVLQGLSDTLFNLNEGLANFETIAANDVPAKLIGFCGGHTITPLGTSCSTAGTSARLTAAKLDWLAKYVKGDATVNTGAPIELQLQDGTFKALTSLPARNVTVDARTVLTNTVAPTTGQGFAGTAGGCRPPTSDEVGKGPGGLTPSRDWVIENPYCAGEWIEVALYGDYIDLPTCKVPGEPVPPGSHLALCERENFNLPAGLQILGVPQLKVAATGIGTEAYAFFKLVDYDTVTQKKVVIDDQVTAHKFVGLGATQEQYATIDLAGVAWEVKPGHRIFLEITATSNDHASSRTPSSMAMNVQLSVPATETAAFMRTPAEFAFGTKAIGSVVHTTEVRVTGTGTAPADVTGIALSGANAADYSIVNDPCTGLSLDAGESCYVTVGFEPGTTGAKAASLDITTSAGAKSVALTGSGAVAPFLSVSPASLAFGEQTVGVTSAAQTITVKNTGSAPLPITTNNLSGTHKADFDRTASCVNVTLAPEASCTIDVTFTPGAEGARTGRLTIATASASGAGNVGVPLTGTGVAAP